MAKENDDLKDLPNLKDLPDVGDATFKKLRYLMGVKHYIKPRVVAYDQRTKKYCTIKMINTLSGECGHIMTKEEFWKTFESWWDDESNIERMVDYYSVNCEEGGIWERNYDNEEEYEEDVRKWVEEKLEQEKKELYPYETVREWKDVVFTLHYHEKRWDDSVTLLAPKTLEPLIASMKSRYGKKRSEEQLEENKKTLLLFPTLEQFYDLYLTKKIEWRPGDLLPEDLV